MDRLILSLLACWLLLLPLSASASQSAGAASVTAGSDTLLVLSYHDIRDDVARKGDPDAYAASTQNFAAHLDWLSGHGYRPVSLSDVQAAARGERRLPAKAVLLTFDDGLRSVYTHAFPLLRAYGYPALVAVVTSWLDLPAGQQVDYGPRPFTGDDFLTWEQLREMQASGLVEVASHSHDLHHGVTSNPQGNITPAAITRVYDPQAQRYESEAEYRARIRSDLATSAAAIERELGVRPRAIVWPYAAYSSISNGIAEDLGMTVSFDLEGREQKLTANLHGLARLLVYNNPNVSDLAYELRHDEDVQGVRAMQVDLDYVYDADPAQQDRNLDALIERVKRIGPSHVFLQAFADPDGNGSADALYFPNRHLPVRADLFNRVAWQLKTRAEVKVFAWLPVLGFEPPEAQQRRELALPERDGDIFRLDPSNPRARQLIADVYEDLAVASYFEGLLFHDDAYLRDDELAALGGADARTRLLIDFTHELKASAERWRPKLATVRNLYALTVLRPESQQWFGQRLDSFIDAYDYTALMAMPWMEGAHRRPQAWMRELTAAVRQHDPRFEKTLFELQTVDWRKRRPIPGKTLQALVRQLQADGVRHLGWYPDDFIGDQPRLQDARGSLSARSFPYEER
ncbi:biofilm PGA synthesis lipoprotein PgaB [Pseudoxanthomonas wuyuanensis]|uniref:Biofilm PGA synthesis lipoprotein PgaB n=2 Tax=Pseudoxanthomonas wuyuanensis TaxID=1073196 RepID=A0A286CW94_9GAMM|nr:poly-beta-1,6-N-acetyl-D-glucosamine N-deacetylase PgaB [Pseudoxanthomonas wuyuanensis]SOD50657.1 biofilm PGA synthesis lipoprotein PgaB [Pseudoxanthomonas wuyuanensis]